MGSVNRVFLVGALGADPELKYTSSGRAVCNLRLATNEAWKDQQGQKQERVEWHRIVVWGDMGEACGKYLAKGRQCVVEGRIQTRQYEKDGQKRYATDIVADHVTFLGGGEKSDSARKPDAQRRNDNDDVDF